MATIVERGFGFKVEKFLRLNNFRILDLDDVPLDYSYNECPSCLGVLKVLCTLVGHGGRQFVRLGCCPFDGHVAYMDRPSRSWIDRYYLEQWGG